jgi:hypothetical protein
MLSSSDALLTGGETSYMKRAGSHMSQLQRVMIRKTERNPSSEKQTPMLATGADQLMTVQEFLQAALFMYVRQIVATVIIGCGGRDMMVN